MTWFRVDDKLHDHRKARAAGKAAMGVWVLCGSWASDNLTDGFVPEVILRRHGTSADAERLVAAGLWSKDEQDGETGWRFHEWTPINPTREKVLADRQAAADRQARRRDAHRDAPPPSPPEVTADVTRDIPGDSRRESHDPDPTRPDQEKNAVPRKRGQRLPEDWQPSAEARAWTLGEAGLTRAEGADQLERFRDHWGAASGQSAAKVDWDRTWRNWVRNYLDRRGGKPVTNGHAPAPSGPPCGACGLVLRERDGRWYASGSPECAERAGGHVPAEAVVA